VRRRAAAEPPASAARAGAAKPRAAATARKVARRSSSIAALGFAAWYGNRQVWFLGTDDGGRVALYRGVPYELPFGIELYDERYASPIQTDSLPAKRRDAVTGHDLRSRDDAVDLIEEIERNQENLARKAAAREAAAREAAKEAAEAEAEQPREAAEPPKEPTQQNQQQRSKQGQGSR
jgi:hypothetical protein